MTNSKMHNQQSWLSTPILKGFFYALAISVALVFLLAVILYLTNLPEGYLLGMATTVLIISVTGGGLIAARTAEAKFLALGWGVGLLYLLLIIVISLFTGLQFNLNSLLIKFLLCSLSGIFGGILGAFMR